MDLNSTDYYLIYKNKIDPLSIFNNQYLIELSQYIVFLIDKGIEVPPKLFKFLSDHENYNIDGKNWPQIESLCYDVLWALGVKGYDITERKYNDVLLGMTSNDSISTNFVQRLAMSDMEIPDTFQYLFEDDTNECSYLFRRMVENNYSKEIPDYIIEGICMKTYSIFSGIRAICSNFEKLKDQKKYLDVLDTFLEIFVSDYDKVINSAGNLGTAVKNIDSTVLRLVTDYATYLEDILSVFKDYDFIDHIDILLNFIRSKKFITFIKSYTSIWNQNIRFISLLEDFLNISLTKKSKDTKKLKESFKSFFYR